MFQTKTNWNFDSHSSTIDWNPLEAKFFEIFVQRINDDKGCSLIIHKMKAMIKLKHSDVDECERGKMQCVPM